MENEIKFERGEAVCAWNRDSFKTLRIFSHMENGKFACVENGHEENFWNGLQASTSCMEFAEKLPKPSPFRKGELVVADWRGVTWAVFYDGKGNASGSIPLRDEKPITNARRPTLDELRAWLPWCRIEAKAP